MIKLKMNLVDSLCISLRPNEKSQYKVFDYISGYEIYGCIISFGCISIKYTIKGVEKSISCIEHELEGNKCASYTIFNDTSFFVIEDLVEIKL
jgi:hypothetical protein